MGFTVMFEFQVSVTTGIANCKHPGPRGIAIPGVPDTGEMQIAGVPDTGEM